MSFVYMYPEDRFETHGDASIQGDATLFFTLFDRLVGEFSEMREPCNMAPAVLVDGHFKFVFSASDRMKRLHSEEPLLLSQEPETEVKVGLEVIDIEPCHSRRYPGRSCKKFFEGGRAFK